MIFLDDASVYVFRAYHSVLPDMRDRDGNPTHAVFGFARFLGDLIERMRPRYMAVAFDQRRADSYRSRIYPAYKANRERAPQDLVLQFERCRELCRHLGVAMFVDPEYEADDLIGTLASLMRDEGMRSAFITRDKDLAQLMRSGDLFWDFGAREQFGYHDIERHFGVAPERSAYITRDKDLAQLVRNGDLYWDFGARGQFGYHDIERYFGVAPERFADYLALTGDDVDNIPGVPGVGHRTAASLMKCFASLEEMYDDLGRVAGLKLRGAGALARKLTEHRETVYLSRRLTRIACDLKLGIEPEGLRRRTPDLAGLGGLYDHLGFGPFLRRQGERLAQLPA